MRMMAGDKGDVNVVEEDRWRKDNFYLNTNGCCFICFKPLSAVDGKEKGKSLRDRDGGSRTTRSKRGGGGVQATYSLGYLCRYLKLDVVNILSLRTRTASGSKRSSSGVVPPLEITTNNKSDVGVSLCERCGREVTKFSAFYKEFEMLRMKMGHCLGVIQSWIKETDGDAPAVEQFQRLIASDSNSLLESGVVNGLRKEVGLKCFEASTKSQPRVKLNKLETEKDPPSTKKNSPKKSKLEPEVAVTVESNEQKNVEKPSVKSSPSSDTPKTKKDDPAPSPAPSVQEIIDLGSSDEDDEGGLERTRIPTPAPTLTKEQPKPTSMKQSQTVKVMCNFCHQKGFNSLEEVNKHFSATHLPSILVGISAQAQPPSSEAEKIVQSQSMADKVKETLSSPVPIPGPATPTVTLKMPEAITKPETVAPPHRPPPPAPRTRTKAFPFSQPSKPTDGPARVIYVDNRPRIVSGSSTPDDNADPRAFDCKVCGKTFTTVDWLNWHLNASHPEPKPRRQRKPKKLYTIQVEEAVPPVGIPSSTTSASSSSDPSYDNKDMDVEEPEVEETACVEIKPPKMEILQDLNVSGTGADPLSDFSTTTNYSIGNDASSSSMNSLEFPTTSTPTTLQFVRNVPSPQVLMMPQSLPISVVTPFQSSNQQQGLTTTSLVQGTFNINPFTSEVECRLCGNAYVDLNSFSYHYNSCHAIPQFECNLCGNRFNDYETLKQHRQMYHGEQQVDYQQQIPIFISFGETLPSQTNNLAPTHQNISTVDSAPASQDVFYYVG